MSKKVLIASESAFRRTLISDMLSSHNGIEVVEIARNDKEAINMIEKHHPDVLILDIEFNDKDWYKPFHNLMKGFAISTIVLTDVNPKTLDDFDIPLLLKSYDYIVKPNGVWKEELPKIKDKIISKVLMVSIPKLHKIDSKARLMNKNLFIQQSQKIPIKNNIEPPKVLEHVNAHRSEEFFLELTPVTPVKLDTKIIVIGASVGGPRTLRTIFSEIPRGFAAPILVVQHLNNLFMRQLVTSLRNICKVHIKIGMNYEELHPGTIYFSPGDKHMQVTVKNKKPHIRTFEGEPVHFCRPSVDVLFYSTARVYKQKTLGILLTGMGRDGVSGLQKIKSEGGKTIAESEETSVLYGMPKAAAETGAADLIIPNYRIIDEMIKFVN